MLNLLLLSNSASGHERYLSYASASIGDACRGARRVIFFPFASVRIDWEAYSEKVQSALSRVGVRVVNAALASNAQIACADVYLVGGGNTFQLLREMRERGYLELIARRVRQGATYIGWSAGANIACPTIATTNDMPVVFPGSFDALGLVPFQINPHYTDRRVLGLNNETRRDRIAEFLALNRKVPVVALPEKTWLRVQGGVVRFEGERKGALMRFGRARRVLYPGRVVRGLRV